MTKPGPETLELWTALLVAYRHLTEQLDADLRRSAGVSVDEYDVLYQLRLAGRPLRMSELAALVLISRPSTSRVTDRLVERNWIDRWHDDKDRRVVLVTLTPAGRRVQTRAGRCHLEALARLVEMPLAGHDVTAAATALRAIGTSPRSDRDEGKESY